MYTFHFICFGLTMLCAGFIIGCQLYQPLVKRYQKMTDEMLGMLRAAEKQVRLYKQSYNVTKEFDKMNDVLN